MDRIRGYSSPFSVGHKALANVFEGVVIIQEKIDGSQFSFVWDGEHLLTRSNNVQMDAIRDHPTMFAAAINWAIDNQDFLHPGWTYRGEYLMKPKHNTLEYARVPQNNIILFDIDQGDQDYLSQKDLETEAGRIGLEAVPLLAIYEDKPKLAQLKTLLDTPSILGKVTVEGVVIKNYSQYGPDKKVLMGKYVSEKFVEKHSKDWKHRHPTSKDIILLMGEEYKTDARWRKAIQHAQEKGSIEFAPQDIPVLMKEITADILKEEGDEIKERLFKHFWPQVSKLITRGFPEWYKNWLVESALEE